METMSLAAAVVKKITRHRASTSMYWLALRVRVMLPC